MQGRLRSDIDSAIWLLLIGIVLTVVAVSTATRIAATTHYNSHPDEAYHLDAFCYFQDHLWPPDLNSDEVIYSPYGWSRVYTGEAVYLVYGQLGAVMRPHTQGADELGPLIRQAACRHGGFRLFRYLNVALYAVTLAAVFAAGRREFWVFALGVALAVVPQVVYTYGYANSDAWALSWSVFLLLFALRLKRKGGLSWLDAGALGVLTGMALLTKKPFWLTIPFAYLFVAQGVYPAWRAAGGGGRRRLAAMALLSACVAFVVAGPLLFVYPWTQGDFAAGEVVMREARALEGFKPSEPTYAGVQLAARGEPFHTVWVGRVWEEGTWWSWSAKSVYGVFGHMLVFLPVWMYAIAALIALLGLGFTFDTITQRWREISTGVLILLAAALALILINVGASLYNSWMIDYQPQGRYLFPSLLPFAYLWAGLYDREPGWMQRTRWALLAALWMLGVYVLWSIALTAPLLTGG